MTTSHAQQLGHALRWALESSADPSTAAVDWLAQDIDSKYWSAIKMLTAPETPVEHLRQAKDAYKTMRVIGETSSDRRVGARFYCAAIAAAMANHGRRISRQSDAALARALNVMLTDREAPDAFRELASRALNRLKDESTQRQRSRGGGPSSNGQAT